MSDDKIHMMSSCYVSYLAPLQISRVWYPYYQNGVQEGVNIQVCLKTNRIVTESVYIHVETSHATDHTAKTDI